MTTHQERNAQTEAAIIDALVKVGREKPLSQITVTDLIKVTGISRGTFYLHYLDKDDLIERLKSQFMTKLKETLDQEMADTMNLQELATGKPYPVIFDILSLVAKKRPLLTFLLGPNGDASFYRTVVNELQTAILRELRVVKGTATFCREIPEAYAINLVTNTIVSTIMVWLTNDDNLTSDELAHVIMRELYLSPYQILEIDS